MYRVLFNPLSKSGRNKKIIDHIKQRINYLILNRYLVGYLFKNEQELILNEKKALNRTKNSCPCCGGKMVIENNMEKCEYCGYIVKDRQM